MSESCDNLCRNSQSGKPRNTYDLCILIFTTHIDNNNIIHRQIIILTIVHSIVC